MAKPQILILENSIAVTGALNSILRSSEDLRHTYDFHFILPSRSRAIAKVQQSGFSVHEIPMMEIRKNFISIFLYVPIFLLNTFRLRSLIQKLEIQIIVNNDFYNLIPSLYKFMGGAVPYLCYVRFRPLKFPTLLIKLWCGLNHRFATHIIAVSEIVKKELPIQTKVVVISNELPLEEISYQSSLSSVILYPANYMTGKGHAFALRSFAAIHNHYPQWKLRFVGSDMGLLKNKAYKQELQQESFNLGIDEKIEWGSFVTNILEEYSNASIVLNFSESESFSLTCLEAMYCGRAIIATNSGGPAEIIDADTGILVNLGDEKAMSQSLEFLITHPAEREDMGQRAYHRVRSKFSFENTGAKLGNIYNSIIYR